MKSNLLKGAASTLMLLSLSNSSFALPVSVFTGRFQFYDNQGQLLFTDNNVTGLFDIDNAQGYFEGGTDFMGSPWRADVAQMMQWNGTPGDGSVETKQFQWTTETWLLNDQQVQCKVAVGIDDCQPFQSAGGALLSSVTNSYTFSLTEGQFAGGVFIDWGGYVDIPVVSAMQIADVTSNVMTMASIDTDHDGTPGTASIEDPFAGSTWSFDGQQVFDTTAVPVPPALWLFASGVAGLSLGGLKRRRE